MYSVPMIERASGRLVRRPVDSTFCVARHDQTISADSHAANSTPVSGSGVVEVEGASVPPGDSGVGDVGCAEDG